jgi:hypothetical protein
VAAIDRHRPRRRLGRRIARQPIEFDGIHVDGGGAEAHRSLVEHEDGVGLVAQRLSQRRDRFAKALERLLFAGVAP